MSLSTDHRLAAMRKYESCDECTRRATHRLGNQPKCWNHIKDRLREAHKRGVAVTEIISPKGAAQ